MFLAPGLQLRAHVEVFKREEDGRQTLVRTSRPCPQCGGALDGARLVVPLGKDRQIHADCAGRRAH